MNDELVFCEDCDDYFVGDVEGEPICNCYYMHTENPQPLDFDKD